MTSSRVPAWWKTLPILADFRAEGDGIGILAHRLITLSHNEWRMRGQAQWTPLVTLTLPIGSWVHFERIASRSSFSNGFAR